MLQKLNVSYFQKKVLFGKIKIVPKWDDVECVLFFENIYLLWKRPLAQSL